MKIQQFSFTPDSLAAQLTEQSHQTLYWLNRNGYLDNDTTIDLLERMIVVPIRNEKSFGQRILERFFKQNKDDTVYVFPISMLEENTEITTPKQTDKPNLTVVKK